MQLITCSWRPAFRKQGPITNATWVLPVFDYPIRFHLENLSESGIFWDLGCLWCVRVEWTPVHQHLVKDRTPRTWVYILCAWTTRRTGSLWSVQVSLLFSADVMQMLNGEMDRRWDRKVYRLILFNQREDYSPALTNHLSYTFEFWNLNTRRNHHGLGSISPILMSSMPRRVKLLPSASPIRPLLIALAIGSLCLGSYSYLFILFSALAPRPLAWHLQRSGTAATRQHVPVSFGLSIKKLPCWLCSLVLNLLLGKSWVVSAFEKPWSCLLRSYLHFSSLLFLLPFHLLVMSASTLLLQYQGSASCHHSSWPLSPADRLA